MDLSVIILNLNTQGFLRDCLRSVESSNIGRGDSKYTLEIIVSDNGSTDGSLEMVKTEFPGVKLVENGQNLGFTKGNNVAIPYATGRYLLFLNSDTVVLPDTLSQMIDYMDSNPSVGASTCYVELFNGKMDMNCHRGFPTPWVSVFHFSGVSKRFPRSKLFGGYFQTYKNLNEVHEVDVIEGSFMMVRREAAEQVALSKNKWWDEDFFFYGDDIDFCYRLREAGWKIMYYPKVKILHYKGATHGFSGQGVVKFSQAEKAKLVKATTDGMRLFYEKHYKGKYNPAVTALVLAAINSLARARSLKGGI